MNTENYIVLDTHSLPTESLATQMGRDVLEALSQSPKRLPSRYLYDQRGSELFTAITNLEAYYPTRRESEILHTHARDILDAAGGTQLNIVDLGAGDGRKTQILLDAAADTDVPTKFVPIDISETAVRDLTDRVSQAVPDILVEGLVTEYFDGLRWLSSLDSGRSLVLFLGSNIGNFDRAGAQSFLRLAWSSLNDGDLMLIGFDRKKDIRILTRAYDDPEGVTALFNLNLLTRLNRELGADFDVDNFMHYPTYDARTGAMHSYLLSRTAHTVSIQEVQRSFQFKPWEPIHMEYSYKYLESDITSLAEETGFEEVAAWDDFKGWFTDRLWRVTKPDLPA